MFKKNPQPKALANIKSSERRKLYQEICTTYKLDPEDISKEMEVQLLPIVTKQATFKSPQGHSGTIYRDENETPTWFRPRGGIPYPSVFILWKISFLPTVMTHPHVIEVLQNGADLMLPGTIPPFDSRCTKGSVVGIVDSKNPSVIKAVGVCKLDLTGFTKVVGRTGTAVEVLHHMSDQLVELNKLINIDVPDQVEVLSDKPTNASHCEEQEKTPTVVNEEPNEQKDDASAISSQLELHMLEDPENEFQDEQLPQITTDDLDHLFVRAAMQAIKVGTIELPLSSSTFMSEHVLKNLPAMDLSLCNIRKTSWKKTAKYLKALEKLGYVKTKGKGDDVIITNLISKDDPLIQNFITHRSVQSSSGSKLEPTKKKKDHELDIVYLYRPTSKLRIILNKLDKNYDKLYTAAEVRQILQEYIKISGLVDKANPKVVVPDEALSAASKIKESCTREKLFPAFLSTFTINHSITKPGEKDGIILKGEPPKISIISEMRIGRKVVTRVQNFEHYFIKPHILAEELRNKCSGSSTIGQSVQNPNITEVTVQGPHAKLISDWLNKEKGIPVTFIDVEDKTKKKKK